MESKHRDDLRSPFPSNFTQSLSLRKVGIEHPLAPEAIWYFRDKIEEWLGDERADQNRSTQALEHLAEAAPRGITRSRYQPCSKRA